MLGCKEIAHPVLILRSFSFPSNSSLLFEFSAVRALVYVMLLIAMPVTFHAIFSFA